ncbi:uncharacterized protein [Branchiostoma lanceolatum]|uniref:uncharacterized protein n=1 Tax=Branchiostoma lanceolatum TaxID=7740 RepID=UPI0034568DF3
MPGTELAKWRQQNEEMNEEIRSIRISDDIEAMLTDYDAKKQRLNEVLRAPRNREDMFECFKEKFPIRELTEFVDEAESHEVVFDILFAKFAGGPVTAETMKNVYNNWLPLRSEMMEVVPQLIIETPYAYVHRV